MLCKIADLIAEIPEAGGLSPRCREYLYDGPEAPDILSDNLKYCRERYSEQVSPEIIAYMESAYQFYLKLLEYDGFYLHSSAVELFSKLTSAKCSYIGFLISYILFSVSRSFERGLPSVARVSISLLISYILEFWRKG